MSSMADFAHEVTAYGHVDHRFGEVGAYPLGRTQRRCLDGLPGRKVLREHPPASARARHLGNRVDNLTRINAQPPALPGRLRQQPWNPRAFLISEWSDVASSFIQSGPYGPYLLPTNRQ